MELRAILVAAVLILVGPASAGATTFCVGSPPGCAGTDAPSIAGALTDAADEVANPGRDTIRIGPTTFLATLTVAAGNVVDIVGSGDATVLEAPTQVAALSILEPQSAVRDLTIRLAGTSDASGLVLSGTATNIKVGTGASPGDFANGVLLRAGATLSDSTVTLPLTAGLNNFGVATSVSSSPLTTVRDTTITAVSPLVTSHRLLAQRVRLTAAFVGAQAFSGGTLTLEDALVRRGGTTNMTALMASAGGPGNIATLDARHVTVAGDTLTTALRADASGGGHAANLTVRDSVLDVLPDALHVGAANAGGGALGASITTTYSNYPAAPIAAPGGTVNEDHPTRFAPAFVSPQTGDFGLRADSLLIDAGSPGILTAAESATDLRSGPRLLDGDGDTVARRDIGAFEFSGVAPTIGTPTATPGTSKPGEAVSFAVATADADPGDTIQITWQFSDGAAATGSAVAHAFERPGTYTAVATARDRAGHTVTSAPATVTVAPAPAAPADPGPPTTTTPIGTPPAKIETACSRTRRGTRGRDRLTGTAKGDRLLGLGAADRLVGLAGDDCLLGGPGDDVLVGGAGSDRLSGGNGRDRLAGGSGRDTLDGGDGADRLDGGPGADTLKGGAGSDTILAKDGSADTIDCGGGRDTVRTDAKDRLRRCERRLR